MTGLLYLTDGTTRINLLTGIDGFYLDGWNPSIAPAVDTWRQSPLSDGRKLAMSKWANAIETFAFIVSRFTQDDVIYETQELRRMLEAAKQYFIGGSDVPVWLEARGECETNTRYAVICNYSTGNDSDPYHLPFDLDHPVMAPWTLVVERQHWRDLPPGQSTCVQLSATQDYYDIQEGSFVPLAETDDCYVEHNAGGIDTAGQLLKFGAAVAPTNYSCGIRFRNVTIPLGATIFSAYVRFEANWSDADDDCKVTISADDVDASAAFSTYANFMGRARTGASAAWTAAHFLAGTYYDTPDISAVVQEIVMRAGWASGNPISILLDNNASTANAERWVNSFDHVAVRYEPHLIVEWEDDSTRTFGRTATCLNEVYVANKHNKAQLTHMYYYDAPGVFSANLIGAARPFAFLPAVPAVGDMVYFGICTTITDSGPFSSLVFDIGTAVVDVTSAAWQYYDSVAAGWHALTNRDNTNNDGAGGAVPFNTTGVNSVHWMQPEGAAHNWGTVAVNGITGYWVRVLVNAIGGAPAAPTQQNRDIYTVVTPYIDTLAAQVPGDIPALARLLLDGQSGASTTIYGPQHIVMGLRSYAKGSDFSAFINLADEQNNSNILVTVNAAAVAAFTTDAGTPTGRMIRWTTGGAAAETWLTHVRLTPPLVNHYAGTFRIRMRYFDNSAGVAQLGKFRLSICTSDYTNIVWRTGLVTPTNYTFFPFTVDFGLITLPPQPFEVGKAYGNLYLRIDGVASAAVDYELWDLIVTPADECYFEAIAVPQANTGIYYNPVTFLDYNYYFKKLDIDSLIPRRQILTDIVSSTSYTLASWIPKISGPLIWQPNEHQRWWVFQDRGYAITDNALVSNHEMTLSAQAWKVSRYLSMRGAR